MSVDVEVSRMGARKQEEASKKWRNVIDQGPEIGAQLVPQKLHGNVEPKFSKGLIWALTQFKPNSSHIIRSSHL